VLVFISISRGWRYMYWFSPFTFYAIPILMLYWPRRGQSPTGFPAEQDARHFDDL
jgi:hypothetical protein